MPSTSAPHIVIATRESRLALWQAEHVKALLEGLGCTVQLLGMTTQGDQILDRSLSKVGGKGLFVKELEVALEEGRADIAVPGMNGTRLRRASRTWVLATCRIRDRAASRSGVFGRFTSTPG